MNPRTRYSRRAGIWLVGALILALALSLTAGVAKAYVYQDGGGSSSALAGEATAAPTIVSDQPDYPPGATVTLAGANWQGDTSVRIQVDDDAGKSWSRDVTVPVAGDGTIVYIFDLPDWFVAVYTVKATGLQTDRVATTSFTDAVPIGNDFNQAANGNPHDGLADWIGSVLNETKTSFKEGMSTPQRLVIKDGPEAAVVDANGYQYWTFGVAFQHNGKYAYDFPTGSSPTNNELWGQARADGAFKDLPWVDFNYLDDLQNAYLTPATFLLPASYGGTGGGALKQVEFPDVVGGMPEPENTQLQNIIAAYEGKYGNRFLDIYHDGSMLEAPAISSAALQGSLNYSSNGGTVYVNYTVRFKPDLTNKPSRMYIAWGGHIAVGYDGSTKFGGINDDWGLGKGAGAISGAPYHIKMAGWTPDGNIGSQDNQIMASAVIAPGLKSGYKFNDLDGDGVRDANEPGLSGWTINVTGTTTGGAAVNQTTTTLADDPATPEDEAGYYEFILDPGTYTVFESLQTGWNQTRPFTGMTPPAGETIVTAGNGTKGYQFTMAEAQDRAGNDFGNRRNQGRIIVTKVITPAGYPDSIADTDFPFTVTGPSGPWSFDLDLLASSPPSNSWDSGLINIGSYEVTELVPAGWDLLSIVTDDAESVIDLANAKATLDLDPDETITVTYTDSPVGGGLPDKSGVKFEDLDADGVKDAGEPGLPGWTIYVDYDGDGTLDAGEPYGVTDANGEYMITGINVTSESGNTYKVREVAQAGWTNSYPALGYYEELFTNWSHYTDNDFGNWYPATKSGTKFEDLDADGMPREIGEHGLSGWTIYVDYDGDGSLDAGEPSAVTAADGSYTITGITPGTYKVREEPQAGWTQSYPAGGFYTETFKSREAKTGNDFGNWANATKTGMKFEDTDADAVKDAGEPGLGGWTIEAVQGGQVVASTTTAADGSYSFSLAPGTYTFREVLQAGWTQSYPAAPGTYTETLTSRELSEDNDFGNYQNATKSGTKFEDMDADGMAREAGEPGLPNWTIQAWQGAVKVAETTTDANGAYSFSLKPGSYTINEVQKAGWNQSFPGVGSQGTYQITLSSGEIDSGNDFGNYRNATKSGMKFEDLDADGVKDAGEPGLGGWAIEAVQGGQVVSSTTTDADGKYSFSLKPGTYTFREVQQAGWTQSYPAAPGTYTEDLESGEKSEDNDFGNWYPATKSGTKFEDLDADGAAREGGEPGLPGWTIFVDYDDDGRLDGNEPSDVTDADGDYTITGITPGTYKVREVLKNGWNNSYPALGYYNETFESRDEKTGNDFGNYQNATKSGMKFEDLNADGVKDAGEPGLGGWTIQAVQNGNVVASTTTAADGTYSFSLKPGTYTFREVQKAGWTQSYPAAPGTYSETLKSGEESEDNDFGNWAPAIKSGYKWHDLDKDGIWDTGEPGLSGWTIQAWQNGTKVAETTTGSDGKYSFSLKPGEYTFNEVQKLGWAQSYPAAPGTYTETLTSRETSEDNDFGNYAMYKAKTPGYWKTHPEVWDKNPNNDTWGYTGPYYPDTLLSSVFTIPGAYVAGSPKKKAGFMTDTLLQALNYQGGSTLNGKAQILFRAATAALLNSVHPMTNYPYSASEIIAKTNTALAQAASTGDTSFLTDLAAEFDYYNNFFDF